MQIRLIRHATLQIRFAGKTLLVDPMLSPASTMTPVPGVPDARQNPVADLPVPVEQLLQPDAVLLTHRHRDHWDAAAAELLNKDIPVLCQPRDKAAIAEQGFRRLLPVRSSVEWAGIRIRRTGGRHGRGALGRSLGPVSGFVLEAEGEPTLYIAGDTVWCADVRKALERHQPHVAVLFAGAARFAEGSPVTMAERDIAEVCWAVPEMQVVVTHMEAWNHCRLTRQELRQYVRGHGLARQVAVPEDGETLEFRDTAEA
ncbi:hypothetical protein SD70_31040 [Gordoniibacillus kamchatkensis]|uniref:Metallo-beta-lactamase domain-containing protein n=1 Tax=Gordoniibacillus kamchatkensis TaxID=1590651 RepID=A0ABR5A7U8_9BACL|nr:MBL fold metallo-hydrolase [Paenibacillus sp. VKM B-2647]KIL37136.1 hypothetical protein SD70_31040 [Paenibacillus sp. VKM B-2647]